MKLCRHYVHCKAGFKTYESLVEAIQQIENNDEADQAVKEASHPDRLRLDKENSESCKECQKKSCIAAVSVTCGHFVSCKKMFRKKREMSNLQ